MKLLDPLDIETTIGGKKTLIQTGTLTNLKEADLGDIPAGFCLATAEPVVYRGNPNVPGFIPGLILDDPRRDQICKQRATSLRVMLVPLGFSEKQLEGLFPQIDEAWQKRQEDQESTRGKKVTQALQKALELYTKCQELLASINQAMISEDPTLMKNVAGLAQIAGPHFSQLEDALVPVVDAFLNGAHHLVADKLKEMDLSPNQEIVRRALHRSLLAAAVGCEFVKKPLLIADIVKIFLIDFMRGLAFKGEGVDEEMLERVVAMFEMIREEKPSLPDIASMLGQQSHPDWTGYIYRVDLRALAEKKVVAKVSSYHHRPTPGQESRISSGFKRNVDFIKRISTFPVNVSAVRSDADAIILTIVFLMEEVCPLSGKARLKEVVLSEMAARFTRGYRVFSEKELLEADDLPIYPRVVAAICNVLDVLPRGAIVALGEKDAPVTEVRRFVGLSHNLAVSFGYGGEKFEPCLLIFAHRDEKGNLTTLDRVTNFNMLMRLESGKTQRIVFMGFSLHQDIFKPGRRKVVGIFPRDLFLNTFREMLTQHLPKIKDKLNKT